MSTSLHSSRRLAAASAAALQLGAFPVQADPQTSRERLGQPRLDQHDLGIPEGALSEPAFAVAEVELPHAQEGVAVALGTGAVGVARLRRAASLQR